MKVNMLVSCFELEIKNSCCMTCAYLWVWFNAQYSRIRVKVFMCES